MSEEEKEAHKHEHKHEEKHPDIDLPIPWQRIQGAIWLLGMAILAWQDWWWPGILVLVAISGLAQGAVQWYYSRKKETQVLTERRSN